jgi:hypothetical protein
MIPICWLLFGHEADFSCSLPLDVVDKVGPFETWASEKIGEKGKAPKTMLFRSKNL